ncbi:hypothetical protein PAESOLCIP111_02757 [Paenibacillus solanacearum]|uniref:Uncharacterized protein n=1 Tax=Paenibacillus solanacearum TaxID=2048548 RepID=A0A916K4Y4_9BACL|nr:hypothetical protein PAESOLCIP111_02757 [Paenibacillus solanacearum]
MINYLFLLISFFMFWISMLVFTLILFRQKVKDHTYKMIVCSLLMTHVSIISFTLQSLKMPNYMILFQPVCFIIFYYYIFKIQFLHTLIVTLAVYTINFIAEVSLYLFYTRFHIAEFLEIAQAAEILPLFYLLIINVVLSTVLYKFRIGFTFVPFRKISRSAFTNIKRNTFFLVSSGLFIVIFGTATVVFLHASVLAGLTSVSMFMVLLFHHLYNREIRE